MTYSPAARALSDRIKAASNDKAELEKLDARLIRHYQAGTIRTAEYAALDIMIFDRLVQLDIA